MKYIITESQYKRLNEITVYEGGMNPSESYETIFTTIKNKIGKKKFRLAIKEYLKSNLNISVKNKDFIKDYSTLAQGYNYNSEEEFDPTLLSKDTLSNMAYVLAYQFLNMRKLGNLECFVDKLGRGKDYYFFDPELEMSIGTIRVHKNSYLKNKSFSVSFSAVDKDVRGSGTGKLMYSALLDDVDVLFSDTILYTDSLNIWVNVLPKICYVFAMFDEYSEPKRITSTTKILDHENVERYFATKDLKKVKELFKKDHEL